VAENHLGGQVSPRDVVQMEEEEEDYIVSNVLFREKHLFNQYHML
jgi:hypothetical protein